MSKNYVWGNEETQFFYQLSPEHILDSLDLLGLHTTGRCLPLNSMENRVYEIEVSNIKEKLEIETTYSSVIAKFYRPGRWSVDQILEEHQYLIDLTDQDIPVIAPINISGETLFFNEELKIYYTLFPKKGGRSPDEFNDEQIEQLGRLLARIHNVGASKKYEARLTLTPDTFGEQNLYFLEKNNFLPPHMSKTYFQTGREICRLIKPLFKDIQNFRIHGDCHWGNMIYREDTGLFFIDFDDTCTGPAIQDIWLVIPGIDQEAQIARRLLIEAYETFRDFNPNELKLVEPLRTMRYMHFSAWMAKRWDDPAFKQAFPYFNTDQYWETQTNDLRIQLEKIKEILNPVFY